MFHFLVVINDKIIIPKINRVAGSDVLVQYGEKNYLVTPEGVFFNTHFNSMGCIHKCFPYFITENQEYEAHMRKLMLGRYSSGFTVLDSSFGLDNYIITLNSSKKIAHFDPNRDLVTIDQFVLTDNFKVSIVNDSYAARFHELMNSVLMKSKDAEEFINMFEKIEASFNSEHIEILNAIDLVNQVSQLRKEHDYINLTEDERIKLLYQFLLRK